MKGDTSSGPVSHFQPRTQHTVLMFCLAHFLITFEITLSGKVSRSLWVGALGRAAAACFLVEGDTGIFIGNLSSPLSPKQQRDLEQACAKAVARLEETDGAIDACMFQVAGSVGFPKYPVFEDSPLSSPSTPLCPGALTC